MFNFLSKRCRTLKTRQSRRNFFRPRGELLEDRRVLATEIWSGGDNNNNTWTDNDNWEGIGGAGPNDALVFPAGADQLANNNDFDVNTIFQSLSFNGNGYNITGAQIRLTGGIVTNPSGNGNPPIFSPNILLSGDQTFNSLTSHVELNGVVNLNGHRLTLAGAGNHRFDGQIANSTPSSGSIVKNGTGTARFFGNSPTPTALNLHEGTAVIETGAVYNDFGVINGGNLIVLGTLGSADLSGGTLRGTGSIGTIRTLADGGTVAPGNATSTTGILTSTGNVNLGSNSPTLEIDLNGVTAGAAVNGYDRLTASGDININNSNLSLSLGFTPTVRQTFTIVTTNGTESTISGQFAQGTSIVADGHIFSITYNPTSVVLTALGPAPEMHVSGNGFGIADGDNTPSPGDHSDFGSTDRTVTHVFTIHNSGAGPLNLTGTPRVVVGGAHAADFSVTVQPASPVAATNGSTTFRVVFDPSALGLRTATLSISSDDPDENPYNFSIQGMGALQTVSCTPPATSTTTLTNSTPVTISASGTPTITSTINVSGAQPFLTDADIAVAISHTFSSHLQVAITSPAGTTVTLTSNNGGSFNNIFGNTTWDDDADVDGTVPFATNASSTTDANYSFDEQTGFPLTPEEPLAAFIGENPNGTWTLTIADTVNGEGGMLNNWTLNLKTLPDVLSTITLPGGSNNTSVAITSEPPNNIIESTINIPTGGVIFDVNVTTSITHSFNSDLQINLISPSGTIITLTSSNGGEHDNVFANTTWDDDGDQDGTVPYVTNAGLATDHPYANGINVALLAPEEALGAFIGENPAGTWKLRIADKNNQNDGTLNSWSLNITTVACETPLTWDGGGADNNWSTAANWNPDFAPVDGLDLLFPAGVPIDSLSNTNDITGLDVGSLSVNSSYTLGGNLITLAEGLSGSGAFINTPITLTKAQTFQGNRLQGILNLNGFALTIDGNVTIANQIIGAGGITKNGDSTLRIQNNTPSTNNYTGITQINGGRLEITAPSSLGAIGAGNHTVIAAGATMELDNNIVDLPEAITLNGDGVNGAGVLTTAPACDPCSITGTITLASNSTITIQGDNRANLRGEIAGGSSALRKFGSGTLILSGANTYSGSTTVNEGTLLVNGNNTASAIALNGGTLGGAGTVGAVTASGGIIAPGTSVGTITSGNLSFQNGSTYEVEITNASTGSGFDRMVVTGAVAIDTTGSGVVLRTKALGAVSLQDGQQLSIITNDGNADAVQGTFKDLPEGANLGSNFLGSGLTAKISYKGFTGTQNDVVLTLSPGSFFPWHNDDEPLDSVGGGTINPDGEVSAGDALAIINYINSVGSGPVPDDAILGLPFGFLDTIADNNVAPDDALSVINAINSGLGGEGEQISGFGVQGSAEQSGIEVSEELMALLASDQVEQGARRRRG